MASVDLDQLTADDLVQLAAAKRAQEQQAEARRAERLAVMLERPALGAYRGQRRRATGQDAGAGLEQLRRVAADMTADGWPPEIVARALLRHAARQGGATDARVETAITAGMRAGLRRRRRR